MKQIAFLVLSLLMLGCSDNAVVNYYDKSAKVECMRLVVFPPDSFLQDNVEKLYHFTQECEYSLQVSKKGGIVCNSNQNADKKALSNFPSGYIRFDLYKGTKPIYSYFRDLTSPLSKKDIKKGFSRLSKDLLH